MDIDATTRAPLEPVASWDTASACLVQLGVQNGLDPALAAVRRGDVHDRDTLPISGLIELAGEFELQAERARLDWQGLQTIGFSCPILVLLKNTNVVILTGGGRDGAEEVAVWDPLHRDGEPLFVPRQEFERAWSGDVLRITPQPSSMTSPSLDLPGFASEQSPDRSHAPLDSMPQQGAAQSGRASDAEKQRETSPVLPDTGKEQLSRRGQQRSATARFWVVFAGIVATVGVGLFLLLCPAAEHFAPTSASVSDVSERATEGTPSKEGAAPDRLADQKIVSVTSALVPPTPNAPQSITAVTPQTPPTQPVLDGANRLAALSSEPTSTGDVRALEPSLAVPMPVAPPVSVVVTSEPDSPASTLIPAIPHADTGLSAADITVLLARGDKSFSSGDVASARLYYGRAVDAGDGQAALRLGETFDPGFLERAHLRSARGDLAAALSWYRRARDMGVAEAEVLLNSLEATK